MDTVLVASSTNWGVISQVLTAPLRLVVPR